MTIISDQKYVIACNGGPRERAFGVTIAKEFGLPVQVGEILYSRNIDALEKAEEFLSPQLSMLPAPEMMKDMREAVACILAARNDNQPIFIHGDYDVDGISATALLVSFFRELNWQVFFYIPNRLQENYGLSIQSIDRLVAQCPNRRGVLISVDCGISAVDEVAYARQLGLSVVITDHHEPHGMLPDADALVNPKQPGCAFPYDMLAGVGVAFYLLMALRKAMDIRMNLKQFLDLVALGTVADVVPLTGMNRILVRAGLEVLSTSHRPGLLSLYALSGIENRAILSEDITFKLAPRINAAGRLGCPETSVALLLAKDKGDAQLTANALDQMNTTRKQLESQELTMAEAACSAQVEAGKNGLIVYQPDCHAGILGILASRLVDRYQRPTLVFADDCKDEARETIIGSGRSVKKINLFQVVACCSHVLERFGGHAMAIGLNLKRKNLDQFASVFDHQIGVSNSSVHDAHQTMADYRLDASMLTANLARAIQWLQPFGEGNPEPVFLLASQQLIAPKTKNGHLMFHLQGHNQLFPGIGFHLAQHYSSMTTPTDVLFHLKRTWFNGVERSQIHALMLLPGNTVTNKI